MRDCRDPVLPSHGRWCTHDTDQQSLGIERERHPQIVNKSKESRLIRGQVETWGRDEVTTKRLTLPQKHRLIHNGSWACLRCISPVEDDVWISPLLLYHRTCSVTLKRASGHWLLLARQAAALLPQLIQYKSW